MQVQNDSYWYRARRDIGGALHLKREVEQLTGDAASHFSRGIGFEGFFYVKKANKDGDVVATRVSAGTAPTAVKAWNLADNACRVRDSNPADMHSSGLQERDLLGTHFQATVVSPVFGGLSQTERLELIVDALLENPTRQNDADELVGFDCIPADGECASVDSGVVWVPERVPKGFLPGPLTSKLQFCARLTGLKASKLSVRLLTPAQWNPQMHVPLEAERHNITRGRRGKLGASLKSTRGIKEAESPGKIRQLLNQGLARRDANIASMRRSARCNGGDPLGHFFHALPPKHQLFVLAKQRRADWALERAQRKATTRAEGVNPVEEQHKKKATLESHETKSGSILSSTARDPIKEQRLRNALCSGMMTVEQRCEAQGAMRLQRIYRNTMLLRAFRRRNRRHLAAIRIQRCLRGCYGRVYHVLFAQVSTLAATRIATRHRIFIAMRQTEERRLRMNLGALVIQNALRRHHAFHYVCWVRKNWQHATRLTKCVRQFLARSRSDLILFSRIFQRRRAHHRLTIQKQGNLKQCFIAVRAVARIAAIMRGVLCRLNYYHKLASDVNQRIVGPAQRLLQRITRGHSGRCQAQGARRRRDNVIQIQRILRGHAQILWRRRLDYVKFELFSLVQLQKVARGYLDRIFVSLKQNEATRIRLRMILVPHLQACVRRKVAMRVTKERFVAITNSLKIQKIWRLCILCREAKWEFQQRLLYVRVQAAACITRRLRGLFARRQYSAMRHAAAGHRLKSARIILRAWLRYRSVQRFAVLKEAWEVEKSAKTLMAWHALRDDVRIDMADVRADVKDIRSSRKWARKRLKALRNFMAEAELRLPKVETQMETLDISDVENGWAEALENEWERLTSQLAMASEEKRIMKVHISRCDAELLELQLEYEDIEVDIDDIAVREQEEFELLRRLEIKRADVRALAGWERRVRNERMRWRVRDVRTRVLKRERKTRTELLAKAIKKREIAMSSTLSIHKRKQFFKEAQREATKEDHASRASILAAAAADEAGALGKLKDTYDSVVSGCAALLQCATFEMRNTESHGNTLG